MFNNFKLRVGHSKLKKLLKGFKREKKVHNLISARKVGIVFLATSEKSFQQVIGFVDFLTQQNLEVCILAYCPEKEIPEKYQLFENVNIFSVKETSWYGKPLAPFADEFQAMDFDILIDLSTQETFPLKWITTLSKAKFKVGNLSYFGNPNDLIINIKPNEDLDYLISQLKHYLNLINNRFAQENVTD
ncbi:MAG: hypothetical protein RBT74_10055 [Tenuifilaceae bacterium]|jgi:hypothetical protein|nr:hypothetical protein [Tenuifilaceae bacterium]